MNILERTRAERLAEEAAQACATTAPPRAAPAPPRADAALPATATAPAPPTAGSLSPRLAPLTGIPRQPGPCPACGCPSFWVSPQSHVRCFNCEPPPRPAFVRQRLEAITLGPFAAWVDRENVLANLGQLPPPPAALADRITEIDPDERYLTGPRWYDYKNETTAWKSILVGTPAQQRPPTGPVAAKLAAHPFAKRSARASRKPDDSESLFDGSDLIARDEPF